MTETWSAPVSGRPAHALVQSFGIASLLIIVGVLSTWVYLKRAGATDALMAPSMETLALNPILPAVELPAGTDELETWIQFGEEAYAAGRVVEPEADNALYYYQKALEQAPRHSDALAGVDRVVRHLVSSAESAIFQGDWTAARRYGEQLKGIRPDDPRAADLLLRANRFEQLENLFARADRQVAAAQLTEPPGDNALETYRRVLDIEPGNAAATRGIDSLVRRLLGVAQSAALAGENERARRFIARVRAIDPKASGLEEAEQLVAEWSEIVSSRHLQGQLEAAAAALEAGRLTAPDEPNALALFDAALELDPGSEAALQGKRLVVRALVERAWTEIGAGRFSAAEATVAGARNAGAESYVLTELAEEIEYQQKLAQARRGEFDRLYAIAELNPRRREVPEYPRLANGDGWVDLRFTVSETGDVVDALVVASSNEAFDEPALRAIRRWTFAPETLNDRPIPVRAGARFSFKE